MLDPHHIETLKFDLDIPSKEDNHAIQNRIIRIFNTQFPRLLDDIFEKYDSDEPLTIASISLQLTPISVDELEKDLMAQCKEQLLLYFEANKKKKRSSIRSNDTTENHKLHSLFFYLHHGVYPWYETKKINFVQQWSKMLNESDQVKLLCLSLLGDQNAFKRLLYHLDENALQKTLEKLLPKESNLILQYHKQLYLFLSGRILRKETSLVSFNRIMWLFSLEYICAKNTTLFSLSNFMKHHTEKLALHCELQIADLITGFSEVLKKKRHVTSETAVLNEILDTKFPEYVPKTEVQKEKNTTITILEVEKILIRRRKSAEDIRLLRKWLFEPQNMATIRKFWIEPLREKILENAISTITADGAPLILKYHKSLWKLHAIEAINCSYESFARSNWRFTFDYMTTSFSSVFHAKEFVHFHIKRLVDNYHLNPVSFVQNLLGSIHPFISESKGKELNQILNALLKEVFSSTSTKSLSLVQNSKEKLNIQQITSILHSDDRLVYKQSELLKSWLRQKDNWITIQEVWITNFNEKALKKCIEILVPRERVFISQYIEVLVIMFGQKSATNLMVTIRKEIYLRLIKYLVENTSNFQRNDFIKMHLQWLLDKYNLNEQDVLRWLYNFESLSAETRTLPLAIVSIFSKSIFLQEKGIKKSSDIALIGTADLDFVWQFFETGNRPSPEMIPSASLVLHSSSFTDLQNALEGFIKKNQSQWYEIVKEHGKMIQIHSTLKRKMKSSLLHSLSLFKINYHLWMGIIAQFNSRKNVLNDFEIAAFFYLEEEITPNWISEEKLPIRTGNFSKPLITSLLRYSWTLKTLHRWTYHLTIDIKFEFLKTYLKNSSKHFIIQLYTNLQGVYDAIPIGKRPPTIFQFEMSFWHLFFLVYKGKSNLTSAILSEKLMEKWAKEFQLTFNENTEFEKLVKTSSYAPTKTIEKRLLSGNEVNKNTKGPSKNVSPVFLEDSLQNGLSSEGKDLVLENNLTKWHVANAGIILIHPFLTHFYGLVKYLDEKKQFKDEASQLRAVYLLHYLATGKSSEEDETALAMAKVLCGLPIKKSIPSKIALSEEEMKIANELLSVCIERWEKLGNTDPLTLRNTFLVRKGLLTEKDKNFHLTVESGGVDVLIDFIPWNISMIQLPWLKQLIYVSWR